MYSNDASVLLFPLHVHLFNKAREIFQYDFYFKNQESKKCWDADACHPHAGLGAVLEQRLGGRLAALMVLENCTGVVPGASGLVGFAGSDLCLFVRNKCPSGWRAGGSGSVCVMAREGCWGLSVDANGAGYSDGSSALELRPRAKEGAAVVPVLPYCLTEMCAVP